MLDDISLPNQSMTMSNLSQISQSPFRGTTPSRGGGTFQVGNFGGTQTQSTSSLNLDTIGPSETGIKGKVFSSNSEDSDQPPKFKKIPEPLDIRELSVDDGPKGKDSPSFQKFKMNEEIDGGVSARSDFHMNFENNSKKDEKNRTFADSVLL